MSSLVLLRVGRCALFLAFPLGALFVYLLYTFEFSQGSF